ncbi:MAG: hypothetical protein ACKVVT_17855 [Dehalococcoidia bacterium]
MSSPKPKTEGPIDLSLDSETVKDLEPPKRATDVRGGRSSSNGGHMGSVAGSIAG